MAVSIDLRRAHESHVFGEITQIYTWVNDERAMVLLPTHRKGAPWYIVCESALYKYDDPQYLAAQSRKACEVLGMTESTDTWFKVATIIHDGLETLMRMPSSQPPDMHKGSFGSMQLRGDGQLIAAQDIRLEDEGASYG
jgi:hypothetical protein